MAVNFSLSRGGKLVKLVDVDIELCDYLGKPCDSVNWVCGWYDTIGLLMACGRNMAYIRNAVIGYYYEIDLLKICDYLEANFETDCWESR
jgi:hypothetical protein